MVILPGIQVYVGAVAFETPSNTTDELPVPQLIIVFVDIVFMVADITALSTVTVYVLAVFVNEDTHPVNVFVTTNV